jgi:ADP-heptose:LPS heptosyltransferase
VLLVRLDGIGDALACVPLLASLRSAGHRVAAVLTAKNRGIFARDALSAIYALERIPWPAHGSTPQSRRLALAAAREGRSDAALIASEEMEAYAFARDAGVAWRAGFINGWAKPLKTLRVRALLNEAIVRPASAARACEHEVETLFRLGRRLHADASPTRDVARLVPLVIDEPVAPHGALVVQAASKYAAEGLDAGSFAALAAALATGGDAVRVVTDDAAFAGALASAGARPEMPATMAAWKGIVAGARCVVTPDSGAAHLAGMLGVPCVDLFPRRAAVERDVARWHPWAAPYRAIVCDAGSYGAAFAAKIANAADALLASVAGTEPAR